MLAMTTIRNKQPAANHKQHQAAKNQYVKYEDGAQIWVVGTLRKTIKPTKFGPQIASLDK